MSGKAIPGSLRSKGWSGRACHSIFACGSRRVRNPGRVPIVQPRAPTLLVIEDAHDQAILVGVAARRAHPGLDVRIANHGREGIAYLAGTPPFKDRRSHPVPDLIILDLSMPEVDGFDVLEWIKDQRDPVHVPVVVLTSSMNPDDKGRSLDLGAKAVYKKPTDLDDLGKVVREIVQEWIGESDIIGAHISSAG